MSLLSFTIFPVIDFIFYFILRGLAPVPIEQNVFVALQLGFSLAKFNGGS